MTTPTSDTDTTSSSDDAELAPAAQTDEPRLTQSEVDRLVKDRLARERAKYADYDDLKSKAEKLSEIEDAQKSELEKAREEAAKRSQELDDLRSRLRENTIRSAIDGAASRHGAVNPEQVRRLLDTQVEIDDDGNVVTDVDTVVAEFLSANPHLVSSKQVSIAPAPGVAQGKGRDIELTPEMLAEIDPKELAMNPELREAYIKARDQWR